MNTDEVIRWLERQEEQAGRFARPHWRNAIKEIGYAKHMAVEDRVADRSESNVTPINRVKYDDRREG